MPEFIIIFTFFFDLFTLLVCAIVLHQVVKDRIVLAHFANVAQAYIDGFTTVALKHNEIVEGLNETKDVVNNHAKLLQQIYEAVQEEIKEPVDSEAEVC